MLQNRRFSALASRSIRFLELQIASICVAVAINSIVLCNSADRSGMAASRFLAAAAAGVIQLCFAAGSRKSYCNGCMTVANCAAPFFQFGIDIFSFQIPFKKCFKIVLLPLWRRDRFLGQSGFLAAAAASVIQLCLAAESRKSNCDSFMDAI